MGKALPLEILLYTIDLLAGGRDIESLRILSQACKSTLPLCRKHLFSSLRLCGDSNSVRFSDLLSKNPDIARYVRSLNYLVLYNLSSCHEVKIFEMLKKCSSLRSIELCSAKPDCEWNNLTESIRSSMLSLIQLPTVTPLIIYSIRGFPATALSECGNLIDLSLGALNLASPEVNQVISRGKIPAPVSLYIKKDTYCFAVLLNSASLHAGGPIVDFSRLQKAEFHMESQDEVNQVIELIRVTTRLEYIKIKVNLPVSLAGLGESLAINSYRTLKFLNLSITVVGDDCDPLCGLSSELRFITGNNILEELNLYVCEDRAESEDWSAFDSVLTGACAFPILHRVSVEIYWLYGPWMDDLNARNLFMESYKKDKFPQLVESKAVEFNFRML